MVPYAARNKAKSLLFCLFRFFIFGIDSEPFLQLTLDKVSQEISVLSRDGCNRLNRVMTARKIIFVAGIQTPEPSIQEAPRHGIGV